MSRLLKYILVMAALCCAAEASARIFTKRDYEITDSIQVHKISEVKYRAASSELDWIN